MRKALLSMILGLVVAATGCQRSGGVEGQSELKATQQAEADKVAEKERALAKREEALQAGQVKMLERKERELAVREAELVRKEHSGSSPASAVSQSPARAKHDDAPRETTVTVQLRINMTKPDGKAWDAGGGAPDPEIVLKASNGTSAKQAFSDSLSPAATFKAKLKPGDTVTVSATDKDALANDPIGSFTLTYSGQPTKQSGQMGAAQVTVGFSE